MYAGERETMIKRRREVSTERDAKKVPACYAIEKS
jgi:hypothetical protein